FSFFFSSRRRHTRFSRDWSSDVCSSDLPTPLSQVANVSTPDGMTITIQPWERGMIPEIERGIHLANIGFNPMNNGESVIISVPKSEERRVGKECRSRRATHHYRNKTK